MSFDQVVQAITDYPYIGVALVFLLCGLGLPLPEELVLLAAGFICAKYPDRAVLPLMMAWCGGAILVGDLLPFTLGRVFGVRLLRLRWLRYFITKQRLATFDRWFRKRGDMVIVISRFLAGVRVVAFFTAGAMKMRWLRFLMLDGLGIALMVPLLTWIGFRSAGVIEEAIEQVAKAERWLLWGVIATAVVLGGWYWWWRRRRQKLERRELQETFVKPGKPVQGPPMRGAPPLPDAPAEEPEHGPSAPAEQAAEQAPDDAPRDAPQEPGPDPDAEPEGPGKHNS